RRARRRDMRRRAMRTHDIETHDQTAIRKKHSMLVTTHLFIHGTTNTHDARRSAMDIRMEDMRSPEFPKFTLPLFEDVKKAFKLTNGRVFLFSSSGSGCSEAALSHTQ